MDILYLSDEVVGLVIIFHCLGSVTLACAKIVPLFAKLDSCSGNHHLLNQNPRNLGDPRSHRAGLNLHHFSGMVEQLKSVMVKRALKVHGILQP